MSPLRKKYVLTPFLTLFSLDDSIHIPVSLVPDLLDSIDILLDIRGLSTYPLARVKVASSIHPKVNLASPYQVG